MWRDESPHKVLHLLKQVFRWGGSFIRGINPTPIVRHLLKQVCCFGKEREGAFIRGINPSPIVRDLLKQFVSKKNKLWFLIRGLVIDCGGKLAPRIEQGSQIMS